MEPVPEGSEGGRYVPDCCEVISTKFVGNCYKWPHSFLGLAR